MSSARPDDTIAAISSPPGVGGIGIVRLSGSQVKSIAERIFRKKKGTGPWRSHRFYLGEIIRPGEETVVDEVLLVYMGRPKTYTREDVVEIQCHGGPLILREILELLLRNGARLAEPGEFTKRAFLNGRIDLAQAEAVIDLIHAQTQRSLQLANTQRTGKLGVEVRRIREELLDLLASLEAGIDFPEEEIPELSPAMTLTRIQKARCDLEGLLRSFHEGKVYREGVAAAIIGRPNVGKSSLLNALLKQERAIVTPFPGTTRDVVEEVVPIRGIPLKVMDTAGLRSPQDAIEEEGIRRTRECLAQADLAIWVLDGSQPLAPEDLEILAQVRSKQTVVALNKNDLPQCFAPEDLQPQIPQAPLLSVSALSGSGLEDLKDTIQTVILNGGQDSSAEILLSNIRHKLAAEAAHTALSLAEEGLQQNLSAEFIAVDLRQALEALGEILGESASPEVLERIFAQFCIGK